MKKVSFVVAILVSAALAGCHHKKASTAPTGDQGSAAGSAAAGSGDAGSAAAGSGGGSAM
jgi:hypothetical protein